MNVLGLDTETTGLKPEDGDRIIEVALLTYDSTTRRLVDKYVQRIDPECAISAKAQEIHGISYSDLVGMPKFRDVAPEVHKRINQAHLVIAHNLPFDANFILHELTAAGLKLPNIPSVDTMDQGRWACPDGKFPKLQELCFALGVSYDTTAAHAAEYDVEVMMQCFWHALDRGFYFSPVDLTLKEAA